MKRTVRIMGLALAAIVLFGMAGMAQDVEPPFTWKGKGVATILSEFGTNDIEFDIKFSIDTEGTVKGKTSNEDGESSIKHLFYAQKKEYEFAGLFSRKAILILLINEDGDNPMLCVLNGRFLLDKFFYGEALITKYEAGSEVAKGLEIGSDIATEIDEDYLPSDLKSALKKCIPFGAVQIKGEYAE